MITALKFSRKNGTPILTAWNGSDSDGEGGRVMTTFGRGTTASALAVPDEDASAPVGEGARDSETLSVDLTRRWAIAARVSTGWKN